MTTEGTENTEIELNRITTQVIGAAIDVHRALGPGLLESAYETCLAYELAQRGLNVERQKPLPIVYKGISLDTGYRLDLLVERKILLELKAVDSLTPPQSPVVVICSSLHKAQLLSYLKLSGLRLGLLINFNVKMLKRGIQRVIIN